MRSLAFDLHLAIDFVCGDVGAMEPENVKIIVTGTGASGPHSAARRTSKMPQSVSYIEESMETAKLSSKGQVTLPKSVRAAQRWEAGTQFVVQIVEDGVLLKPVRPFAPTRLKDTLRP